MNTIKTMLACLLVVPLQSCASSPAPNAPVTVWYELTYTTRPDGSKVQKVETIPWADGLTLMHAITSAGGYSTPPVRHVYLVRDGNSVKLDMRAIEDERAPDPSVQPGDKIELRATQNTNLEPISGSQ